MGLFYQMIQKYLTILYPWVSRSTIVKLTKIQAWQELVLVLDVISKTESREKASKLSFWWSDDTLWKNVLSYVYILTYSIDILCFIELLINLLSVFGYFLVCSVIHPVIINAVKH